MFYLVIIKNDSQSVARYDDQNAALAAFHAEMSYAYNIGATTTCVVMNSNGKLLRRDSFEQPTAAEEIETE